MPKVGLKGGAVKNAIEMPKGMPKRIEEYDELNVQELRIGMRHSAVISRDGQLYTYGSGNWGVLGHGNERDIRFDKPKRVERFSKEEVVDIALGEYHSLALTADGNVWTWGYGGKAGYFNWMYAQEVGALGHGGIEPNFTPKKVQFFPENGLKVTHIAAGNTHCAVLCDDGNLYNWGVGTYGILGNGTNDYALTPIINEEFAYMKKEAEEAGTPHGFRKLDAANEFTAVVMEDGQLFVWGKNEWGQMGVGAGIGIDLVESENLPSPVDIAPALPSDAEDKVPFIIDVAAGMRTMMIRDAEDRVLKTGLKIDWSPKLVGLNPDRIEGKIKQMACGRGHYALLDSKNQLHVFGKVLKEKAEEEHDGFGVYDGNDLFDEGEVLDLQMKYETFGALVKNA